MNSQNSNAIKNILSSALIHLNQKITQLAHTQNSKLHQINLVNQTNHQIFHRTIESYAEEAHNLIQNEYQKIKEQVTHQMIILEKKIITEYFEQIEKLKNKLSNIALYLQSTLKDEKAEGFYSQKQKKYLKYLLDGQFEEQYQQNIEHLTNKQFSIPSFTISQNKILSSFKQYELHQLFKISAKKNDIDIPYSNLPQPIDIDENLFSQLTMEKKRKEQKRYRSNKFGSLNKIDHILKLTKERQKIIKQLE